MGMITGQTDDPFVLAFEKHAKSAVDKSMKAKAKEGVPSPASTMAAAVASQSKAIDSVVKSVNVLARSVQKGGGRGGGKAGGKDGGKGGGKYGRGGGGGGDGSRLRPGDAGFECWRCGANDHLARDCPNE